MTAAALVRVSVVAGGRRLDLAVPPALPVAELVPGLARHLGVVSYDGLRLCRASGEVLDDRAGLTPQDVPDGAVLTLAPAPPPPTVHDDPAEALAGSVPPGGPPSWWRLPVAVTLLLLGAAGLLAAADARIAAILALLLLAGGIGPGRARPVAAVVACLAASGYAALAAALLASELLRGPGVVWATAGGAVLAVASLAMAALPSYRLRLLPALVVGAAAGLVGAVLSLRAVPIAVVASVLLVVGALLAGGAPWLAAGRLTRPRGRVDVEALAAEARTARELLVGLSVGLGAIHLALVPVVARHGPFGLALAASASGFVLLRGCHPSAPSEKLAGLVSGGLGLLITAGVALWAHEAWRPTGALVVTGLGGVLLVSAQAREHPSLVVPPLLRGLESACLVALVPLLVLATGVLPRLP